MMHISILRNPSHVGPNDQDEQRNEGMKGGCEKSITKGMNEESVFVAKHNILIDNQYNVVFHMGLDIIYV